MLLQELKVGCDEDGSCGLFYCQVMGKLLHKAKWKITVELGYGLGAISVAAIIVNLFHWRLSRKH